MPTTYKVTILNGNIVSLIQIGEGDRWTRGKAKKIESVARVIAPHRSGRLAASHVTLPTTGSNQYEKTYRVSALAPYAIYPYHGTGIYGPRGRPIVKPRGMKIPGRNPNVRRVQGRSGTVIYVSKGQHPKRWLERAASIALGIGFVG